MRTRRLVSCRSRNRARIRTRNFARFLIFYLFSFVVRHFVWLKNPGRFDSFSTSRSSRWRSRDWIVFDVPRTLFPRRRRTRRRRRLFRVLLLRPTTTTTRTRRRDATTERTHLCCFVSSFYTGGVDEDARAGPGRRTPRWCETSMRSRGVKRRKKPLSKNPARDGCGWCARLE